MFSIEHLQAELKTEFLGREIKYLEEISSTNDDAWECFHKQAPEGTIIITDHQVQGRGRLQSKWSSIQGKSLTFSFLLLPDLAIEKLGILPLLTGVSIVKGIYTIAKCNKPAISNPIKCSGKSPMINGFSTMGGAQMYI